MVQETFDCLKTFSRDFKEIQNASQNVVNWGNQKLSLNYDTNLSISENLPSIRIKKKDNFPMRQKTIM